MSTFRATKPRPDLFDLEGKPAVYWLIDYLRENADQLVHLARERFQTIGPESYPDEPILGYSHERLEREALEELADGVVYIVHRLRKETP